MEKFNISLTESSPAKNDDDFMLSFRYERDKYTVINNHEITVRENINLNDLKLKSLNAWKVVIKKDDILKSMKALSSPNFSINLSTSTKNLSTTQAKLTTTRSKLSQVRPSAVATATAVVSTTKQTKSSHAINSTSNTIKSNPITNNTKSTLQTTTKSNPKLNNPKNAINTNSKQLIGALQQPHTSENIISSNEFGIYNPDTFNFKLDENVLQLLYRLDGDELKLFNFTLVDDFYYLSKTYHTRIDETFFIEKYKNTNENKAFNICDLKKDQIVWSLWRNKGRNMWWPSRIVKVIPQRKNCKFHVYIKHYEMAQRLGNLLKIDTTQIEPFFWSIQNHYNYKLLATEFKPQRFEFFTAYSNALIDFEEQSRLADSSDGKSSEEQPVESKKYLIHGRLMCIDEIKRLAYREPSRKLNKVLNERSAYSQSLINLLVSNECKEFIISIITKRIKNRRHKKYLKADTYARENHLKCESNGPLSNEHQQELKFFLNDLSRQYFLNKPTNLTEYENDVLYPEAVIWGIKKLENLTEVKAERKFKQGFQILEEEIFREKCSTFLREHEITENNKLLSSILEDFKLEDYNFDLDPIDLIEPSLHDVMPEPITNFIEKLEENDSLFGSDTDSLFGDDFECSDEQPLIIDENYIQQPVITDPIIESFQQSNQQLIIIPLEANEIVYTEQNINSVESGYDVTSPCNFDTIGAIIESLMLSPKDDNTNSKITTNLMPTLSTTSTSNECTNAESTDSIINDLENCYFFEYDVIEQENLNNENSVC